MNKFNCIFTSYLDCLKSIFEAMTMRTKPKYSNLNDEDETYYLNKEMVR